MQLFKVDKYKTYEKVLAGMTAGEFFSLDHVPEGLSAEDMIGLTESLTAEAEEYIKGCVGEEEEERLAEFSLMTIRGIIIRRSLESGDLTLEEIFEDDK